MSFRDYSADPDANTTIGETIYIGPNMARNDVRPALQQIAADGKEVFDYLLDNFSADPALTGLARISTRAALAALTDHDGMRILAESGREGVFVFDSSDLSAQVTADPAQAIYVPPSAASTGASGAWVRKFTGPKDARWFGAVGNGTTDDATALQRWLDSGGNLYLPPFQFYSSAKLIVRKCIRLKGASYGFDGRIAAYKDMPGSKIRFAAGVGGLDIQPQVSTTDWASTVPTQEGAYNSVIEDIALIGPNTGAAATGLYARTLVHLRNIWIIDFQGKGFDISASIASTDAGEGAGYSEYGNASYSTLRDCHAWSCGSHGYHIRGYDANTILVDNCDASSNTGVGFYDESLIGNTYLKIHCIGNSGGDIKAIRTHTNKFHDPYVEGGGTVNISGSNIIIGNDLSGSNTNTGNSPTILGGAQSIFNMAKFQWGYAPGAIGAGTAYAYRHSSLGMVIQGIPDGGGYADVGILNKNGNTAVFVPTGTQNLVCLGVLGYPAGFGVGGTSVQITSKSTAAPALNKVTGEVTTHNASLAAATIVSFTMANSVATAVDTVIVNHVSGGTLGAYTVEAAASAGTITFYIRNNTAGALGEALVLRFALIKGAVS